MNRKLGWLSIGERLKRRLAKVMQPHVAEN
jgi:hypothetical protein